MGATHCNSSCKPCNTWAKIDLKQADVLPDMAGLSVLHHSLDSMLQVPCFANLRASEYPHAPPPAWWAFDVCANNAEDLSDAGDSPMPTVCLDGRAYRVERGTERLFYEQLVAGEGKVDDATADVPALTDFCPEFYRVAEDDGKGEQLLVLEDVCAGLSRPVLCRLRMGTRGAWALEAKSGRDSFSRQRRLELWQQDMLRASGSLGWVVAGVDGGSLLCSSEREGLGDKEAVEHVTKFARSAGPKCGMSIMRSILRQLVDICCWFRSPRRRVHLYRSSLLFGFDGDENDDSDCTAIVRMLGFAHTAPVQSDGADDSGYFVGLLSLVAIFGQLSRPGALFGSSVLPDEPAVQYGQPRAGMVAFAMVRGSLCVLAVTSPDGDDWILPTGQLEPNEFADEAGARIGAEEAGVQFPDNMALPRRILVEGSALRQFAFTVADGRTKPMEVTQFTGPVILSRAVELSLSRAIEWSVVRSTGLGVDRVRAWFMLSDALGLFLQHWVLCMLQQGLTVYRDGDVYSV